MSEKHEQLPVECAKIADGEVMAFVYYGKVRGRERDGKKLHLEGVGPGAPGVFAVDGEALITSAFSANQVHKEVKASMTKIAEHIIDIGPIKPFCVCFVKKDGSERIMNCRLLEKDPDIVLGYVKVIDLDKGGTAPGKAEIRQVDLRNVLWLVLDGIKYTLNK